MPRKFLKCYLLSIFNLILFYRDKLVFFHQGLNRQFLLLVHSFWVETSLILLFVLGFRWLENAKNANNFHLFSVFKLKFLHNYQQCLLLSCINPRLLYIFCFWWMENKSRSFCSLTTSGMKTVVEEIIRPAAIENDLQLDEKQLIMFWRYSHFCLKNATLRIVILPQSTWWILTQLLIDKKDLIFDFWILIALYKEMSLVLLKSSKLHLHSTSSTRL